jgi:hypothetical protein
MRLNDKIVVAAVSSLAILILGTNLAATVGGDQSGDPANPISIRTFTNGDDANVAPGPSIPVGAPVTWTYVVTNTGVVQLIGIVVSDDQGVVVDCDNVMSLAVGASMTCTATGVAVAGPYANIGTVTALAGAAFAMASDPSHYVGVESSGVPGASTDGLKVPMCHRNRVGSYALIQVGADAEPAHVAHGDGRIGGAVPNQPGSVFGPGCTVTAASTTE